MIKGNTSAPAGGGGGNSNNLDASFRDMSYGNGGNAINNGDGTSAFASPPAASKEPKVYQFEPCLSFCCGRFNHVRGVAAVSVAGTVGAGAVVGGEHVQYTQKQKKTNKIATTIFFLVQKNSEFYCICRSFCL